ncbi:hypothetical protein YC2023_011899 [Brassica napus]
MRKGHLYPPVPSEEGEVHGKEGDVVEGNEYERVTVGVVYGVSKILISMKQYFMRLILMLFYLDVEDNSEKMAVKTYKWINNDYIKGE